MGKSIEGPHDPARGVNAGRHGAWKSCASGALIALSLLLMPSRGWADCKIQSIELPVTMVDSRAVATLGINGTEVRMIVDSGAFYSFLTHAAAQQLQLKVASLPWGMRVEGLTGEVEAGMTTVKRLQLHDGEIPDVDFIVGGNAEGNGTMGLLGRNILAFADAEYDLAHGVIRLMFPNDDCRNMGMAYWADGKPVSELELLRDDKSQIPAIQAIAQLNDAKLRVLFDTGAQSLVSLNAARRAGLADLKAAGKVRGAGRGEAAAWTARADSFELGREKTSNARMLVADFELRNIDMLLGIDFFLSHRIYVSKKQRRMYFTYNGGSVFALNAIEQARAKTLGSASAASEPAFATADEPADAAGYARRGAASAARQDFVRALADLNRACAMAPQVAEHFVRRGAVHEAMRQRPLAMKDFDMALQLEPAHAEARLRRAWLRADAAEREGALEDLQALDKTLAPQADQRLQLAQLYERFGLSDRALPQWGLWIAAHPHDAALDEVLNSRCWARTMLNIELDQALDDCDRAIDLQSKNGNYYDSRAWLRLRRGELRKALADYERTLKLQPDHAWSLYGRGIVRRRLGEAEAGQADIEAARKLLPSIDAQAGRHGLAADSQASAPLQSTVSTGG